MRRSSKYFLKAIVFLLLGTVFTFSVLQRHPNVEAFQCAAFCTGAGLYLYMAVSMRRKGQ